MSSNVINSKYFTTTIGINFIKKGMYHQNGQFFPLPHHHPHFLPLSLIVNLYSIEFDNLVKYFIIQYWVLDLNFS